MSAVVELKDLAPLLLKKERAGGDINPTVLTNILRGSTEKNARRKELFAILENHPVLSDRDMLFRNHTERYNFGIKKAYNYVKLLEEKNITDPEEQRILYYGLDDPLGIDVHRTVFISTLEHQADDNQQKKWLPLAQSYKILGAYALTELGHGSNVQGLETTAHYDKVAQEFIINSPTLTSRKWWAGGLGKTANYAIVHARLFLEDGKDVGIQAFLVQLRSLADHQPLPGIEVGDIGPKVGFNSIDSGYAVFHNVRISLDQMMMRHAKVLPDGTFIKPKNTKLVYLAMVDMRTYLVHKLGRVMGMAASIATRFSAARVQGHKPSGRGEFQVLDYQNQQNTLFPLIAISYACRFAGVAITKLHEEAIAVLNSGGGSFELKLAELHAVSSGINAWLALKVCDGIETCRRMCGGHGFTNSSNLGHLFAETVAANTLEGTFDVLVQQHARFLLKALVAVLASKPKASALSKTSSTSFLTRAKQYLDPSLRCNANKPEDFADFKLLLEAFEVRASRIIVRLAKEMEATNNDSNACMTLMTRASTAHAEFLLFEAFVNGVESVPAGSSKVALSNLCALFGSWLIVNTLGDFREDNYLSSAQGELVRQQIIRLLPVIRKNAVLLTDAWDFTDFELNSTIGRYDGDIYRALVKRAADEPLNKSQVAESYEQYLKPLIQSDL